MPYGLGEPLGGMFAAVRPYSEWCSSAMAAGACSWRSGRAVRPGSSGWKASRRRPTTSGRISANTPPRQLPSALHSRCPALDWSPGTGCVPHGACLPDLLLVSHGQRETA